MSVIRIALGVSYDGSAYHGWQRQDGVASVQETLERALSSVADHDVTIVCAGRTDAGVHATGQVVHFNTDASRSIHSWIFGANSNLPHDVNVLWAKSVDSGFHARFSALGRCYRYIIYNDKIRPALLHHAIGWQYRELDELQMQKAANFLLGQHDFSSFRGAECQAHSPIRTVDTLNIIRKNKMIILDIKADGFLHHMVRNIVGVLMLIGSGLKPVQWIQEVLEAKDRQVAGMTASPYGLYLVKVYYPDEYGFPQMPGGPFFLE